MLGNHEGGEGGTNRTYFDYFGPDAGDRTKGYYSFDLGGWHLIALNSNCGTYSFNAFPRRVRGRLRAGRVAEERSGHASRRCARWPTSMSPASPAASDHHSDAASDQTLTTLWDDLYAAGADVILNGHAHEYERFAPLTPDGQIDQARGIREFVVGTGGDDHHTAAAPVHGSEVRNSDSFGVLRLTLRRLELSTTSSSTTAPRVPPTTTTAPRHAIVR